jgi:hypothetical protein
MYEDATEDLDWPPPPKFSELADGTWKLERTNGWATVVTFHSTYEQAETMSQTALNS